MEARKEKSKKRRRGRGEGSIYERKDGRFAAVVNDGYRNGKRVRKTFYGETRGEVQEQLKKALREQQQGLPVAPERQTTAEFLAAWLDGRACQEFCVWGHNMRRVHAPKTESVHV